MAETPLEIAVRAIDGFREKVARLEAANAAKDAALGEYGLHSLECSRDRMYVADEKHDLLDKTEGPCSCGLSAALSDTAGEGWLEVREQAREALRWAKGELLCIEPMAPMRTIAKVEAALDALEVK